VVRLAQWKGWPHKNLPIPYLMPLLADSCDNCGSTQTLSSDRIFWFNVHERHNSGLPNYWLLKIDAELWYANWGRPYKGETTCQKCGQPAVISEMNYPNGKHELKSNCEFCGTVSPQRTGLLSALS
jgi:hypothetical protein